MRRGGEGARIGRVSFAQRVGLGPNHSLGSSCASEVQSRVLSCGSACVGHVEGGIAGMS